MKAVQIKEGIYWVGAIDWSLRNFHGYLTQRGSTYNSYLIVDEKVVLIDNVKATFFEEQLKRISSIIDPSKIDYIVQNHIEMDHSGSLPLIQKYCPNATVIASPKGVEGLPQHYHCDIECKAVKSGEVLELGKRSLHFVQTPMVHWPDNMVSYCPEEKVLFSNDAFGQHFASEQRFDDEAPFNIIMEEAKKYYANIVLPYGMQVKKALDVLGGLDIEVIAPSHGIVWRSKIDKIIAEYQKWANNMVQEKAIIVYDSMWKSTEKMATAIQDAFNNNSIPCEMRNIQVNHMSDIMTDLADSKYICVGSPTLNNNMLPTIASFLTYMRGLAPKNRIGLAFGSFGWGGQSIKQIDDILKGCGFETLGMIRQKYVPTDIELNSLAEKLTEEIKNLK